MIVAAGHFEREDRSFVIQHLFHYSVRDAPPPECRVHDEGQRLMDKLLARTPFGARLIRDCLAAATNAIAYRAVVT